jgi:molybdenum cofactor guanylyltransferase
MGSSKAWLDFCGEPMLTRVTRVVTSVAMKTAVVSQVDQSLPPLPDGCEVVHDRIADAGPLAGIEAGLSAIEGACDAALVVSCDHPLVSASFLRALTDKLDDHPGVVPVHEGRTYPLLAIYRVSVLSLVKTLLNDGERRIRTFTATCDAAEIEAKTLGDGDDLRSLMNVNDASAMENALLQAKKYLQD